VVSDNIAVFLVERPKRVRNSPGGGRNMFSRTTFGLWAVAIAIAAMF
jgi:hypothetical protein